MVDEPLRLQEGASSKADRVGVRRLIGPWRLAAVAWAAALSLCAGAQALPRAGRLRNLHTWAFAIGSGDLSGDLLQRYSGYELLVVDAQEATAAQIAQLKRAGKLVLGYLDVGTIEPYRPWSARLKPFRLDYWPEWGEWYANADSRAYRQIIAGQIAPRLLAKGLDGLFLDNTDMIESHRRQSPGMHALIRQLSTLAHSRHDLLFAQNGPQSIWPMLRYLDGWNSEEVSSAYDFSKHSYALKSSAEIHVDQALLRRIGSAGLLVLATDYLGADQRSAQSAAIADACAAGALPFVSNINLTRIPSPAARCAH